MNWVWVKGVVAKGYRVASGLTDDSPYEDGSVKLQTPFFKKRGVDISAYYPGTVNVDISPAVPLKYHFETTLENVDWHSSIPPETFSFLPMKLKFKEETVSGMLYYPHPESKPGQLHSASIFEILAPKLEGLNYGDNIEAAYPEDAVEMKP